MAPYEPGSFYKRELPCLLAILRDVPHALEAIVIDGYVWLDVNERPGLGGHLFAALGTPIVGVAKTMFRGAPAIPVIRGSGARPLFVSAAGMAVEEAARQVAAMSGAFRIPTLLKRVDQLCRGQR